MKTKIAAAVLLGLMVFGAAYLAGGSTYAFLTDKEKIGGSNGSVEITAAACFDDYDGYSLKWDRHAEKCLDRDGFYHDEIKMLYPKKMDVDEKAGYFHVFAEIPDVIDVNTTRFTMSLEERRGEISSAWATCNSDEEMCRVDFNKSDVVDLANSTGHYELVLHGEWEDGTKYEARSKLALYDRFHWWTARSLDSSEDEITKASSENESVGLRAFDAAYTDGMINVSVEANASLAGISVGVDDGVNASLLNASAFTNRSADSNYTYTANHTPARNGTHNVTLHNVTDNHNETIRVNDTVRVNVTALQVNASGNASLNGSVNASVNSSTNASVNGSTPTGNNTTTTNGTNATNTSTADLNLSYGVKDTELVEGSNASVTVNANNTGNVSGNASITVYVDGSPLDSSNVSVDAESQESTAFEFPLAVGSHEVWVNNLNATNVTVQPKLKASLSLNQSGNVSGTVQASLDSNLAPSSAWFAVSGSSGQLNSTNVTGLLGDGSGTVDWNSTEVPSGDYVLELSIENGTQTTVANKSVTVPLTNTSGTGSLNTTSSNTSTSNTTGVNSTNSTS